MNVLLAISNSSEEYSLLVSFHKIDFPRMTNLKPFCLSLWRSFSIKNEWYYYLKIIFQIEHISRIIFVNYLENYTFRKLSRVPPRKLSITWDDKIFKSQHWEPSFWLNYLDTHFFFFLVNVLPVRFPTSSVPSLHKKYTAQPISNTFLL